MSSGRAAHSCCQQQNGYSAASRGAIGRGRATARAAGDMRAGCVRHVWSSGGLDPAPLLAREAAQHELTFAWRSLVCLHLLTSHSGLDVPCPRASSDAVGGAVRRRAERRDARASRRTRRPARGASEKLKIVAATSFFDARPTCGQRTIRQFLGNYRTFPMPSANSTPHMKNHMTFKGL